MTDEASRLTVGKKAPAFNLKNQSGEKVKLSDFAGSKVLVFFYPKANTGGCTSQACGLRDVADQIGDTVIIGISPDEPDKQSAWDEKYSLGFPLLSDPDHKIADKYAVWGEKKLYGRAYMGIIRSAFLIDEKGKLEQVWYKISPKDTPKKLLAALKG
ncbi:MAG: thioredoxin-dependent thiol peroxidase [Microthrixaceae bacterium]|nr:thioredoxin-dependent thiol peroxidase [Microthrixaceae bacterium]